MSRNHPLYHTWWNMLQRCLNEDATNFPNYGGRGVNVCERWQLSFDDFLEDMGPKPCQSFTLDRINSDGDYSPENCRWSSWETQQNNRRSSRFLTSNDGETLTLTQWARRLGCGPRTIVHRIEVAGWSVHAAITTKVGNSGPKGPRLHGGVQGIPAS